MKIAIASGKGGTGKTTLAVALALAAEEPVRLLDCDVEEPNAHLFLDIRSSRAEPVTVPVPEIDQKRCTSCGKCAEVCEFNAIAALTAGAIVFPELCHGCGGCALACPEEAITEVPREIGTVETGTAGPVDFVMGRLRVGEPMSPPLIRAVKRHARPDRTNILDCPPGTACPVVTALQDCDFALLVTEPTPFGLHDLRLAVETARTLGLPFAVALNRADIGDESVQAWCIREGIPILLEIPHDRRIAEAGSRAETLLSAAPELTPRLRRLLRTIGDRAGRPATEETPR
jgi:MinD superfamily P-loop ATPase